MSGYENETERADTFSPAFIFFFFQWKVECMCL